jgi:hypothetical protein
LRNQTFLAQKMFFSLLTNTPKRVSQGGKNGVKHKRKTNGNVKLIFISKLDDDGNILTRTLMWKEAMLLGGMDDVKKYLLW